MLITLLVLILAIVGLILLMGVSISDLVATLPQYADNMQGNTDALQSFLANRGIDVSNILSNDTFNPTKILGSLEGVLSGIVSALSGVVIMLLILIFMLLDAAGFTSRLHKGFSSDDPILARLDTFARDIRQYVSITTRINILVGVVDTIFLLILGVDFAVLWGILAFLLGYIPSIGFWLALIPPAILAFAEFGLSKALIVLLGYVLINGSVQNFLQPKLMGSGLNLSPLVVVFSLIFWGWVLGPIGALLAIPLTMMVMKLLLESFDETKPLVKLMQSSPSEEEGSSDAA